MRTTKAIITLMVMFFCYMGGSMDGYNRGLKIGKDTTTQYFNDNLVKIYQERSRADVTGVGLLNAINVYRSAHNTPLLQLSDVACDNLAQRFFDLTSPEATTEAHYGLDEWARPLLRRGYEVTEIISYGNSVDEMIEKWSESPGHNSALINKSLVKGCTYAGFDKSQNVYIGIAELIN